MRDLLDKINHMNKIERRLLLNGVCGAKADLSRSFNALLLESAITSACCHNYAPPVQVLNRATRERNRIMYATMPGKAKRDKARAKRKRKSR